jgi:hypothetical protein
VHSLFHCNALSCCHLASVPHFCCRNPSVANQVGRTGGEFGPRSAYAVPVFRKPWGEPWMRGVSTQPWTLQYMVSLKQEYYVSGYLLACI